MVGQKKKIKMNKVIVIDGGNIQFRAIFAYRNNPNFPCAYMYLRMIMGYLKRLKVTPEDKIIIAQDYGSWRKEIDHTYKAQRKDYRESMEEKEWWDTRFKEFNDLYERLEYATPFHFVKIYKMEADDIGSVCCRYYKDSEVILISSDKDWEMLLTLPNVKIFSPVSKKFKNVPHPMKVLLDKIQGDVSDNLLTKPTTEMEYEKRKKIVNLLELPKNIELLIREKLDKLIPKNLHIEKIPFKSVRAEFKKFYNKE